MLIELTMRAMNPTGSGMFSGCGERVAGRGILFGERAVGMETGSAFFGHIARDFLKGSEVRNMGAGVSKTLCALLFLLITLILRPALAEKFQLISAIDVSQSPVAGGNGDSFTPIISADGRFVLFSSSANNLLTLANGDPIPVRGASKMNLFVRDRTNGTTALVSVNAAGNAGGNGNSFPSAISADGRFVLFESTASDLVPGDTNSVNDVFLRDLVSGVTLLVSTNGSGGVANDQSHSPVMTRDGRYIAFVSAASNLTIGDSNGIPDVFLRDMQAAATMLVSFGALPTNTAPSAGSSENPEISADGRYVAFQSTATNLVPGVTTSGDIYVRDTVAALTRHASVDARALFGTTNAVCFNHALSADGNYVAYEVSTNQPTSTNASGMILRFSVASGETEVVNTNANRATIAFEENHSLAMTPDGRFIAFVGNTNDNSGTTKAIYLWDGLDATTKLVSGDFNDFVSPGSISDSPAMDVSGRFVAFLSSSTNLVTNSLFGEFHLYLRDVQSGTTRLMAMDTNGAGAPLSPATDLSISSNGQFVAFESQDTGLVSNDRNRDYDVFVAGVDSGNAELISVRLPSLPSLSPNGPSFISSSSISSNGNFVGFTSDADNLVAGDTNTCRDVFVRNRQNGTVTLVSVATNGGPADGPSTDVSITPDGRFVVFTSSADNLVAGDNNKVTDVFLRDLQTVQTVLVSVNTNATGTGNNVSSLPIVSSDGKYVLFRSTATDIAPGSFAAGSGNLFLRNLQANITVALTTNYGGPETMTPNGKYVAFGEVLSGKFYVRDSDTSAVIYTGYGGANGALALALSDDGRWLAYESSGSAPASLIAVDLVAHTNVLIYSGYFPPLMQPRFSKDGRRLAYTAKAGTFSTFTNEIYLYDFATASNLLVSHAMDSSAGASSNSDSPTISADGRFIAYRSYAPEIVDGDTNSATDIFLYDSVTQITKSISDSRFGNFASDNFSSSPVFSPDGQTLIFESWSSDLSGIDYNHNCDLLAYPFLFVSIAPGSSSGKVVISWPYMAGASYRVEYKNALLDTAWQTLAGTVAYAGNRAYLTNQTLAADQKYYRVVSY